MFCCGKHAHSSEQLETAIDEVHDMVDNLVHDENAYCKYDGSYHNYNSAAGQLALGWPRSLITKLVIRILDILKYFEFHIFVIFAREERLELPTPGFGDRCSTD